MPLNVHPANRSSQSQSQSHARTQADKCFTRAVSIIYNNSEGKVALIGMMSGGHALLNPGGLTMAAASSLFLLAPSFKAATTAVNDLLRVLYEGSVHAPIKSTSAMKTSVSFRDLSNKAKLGALGVGRLEQNIGTITSAAGYPVDLQVPVVAQRYCAHSLNHFANSFSRHDNQIESPVPVSGMRPSELRDHMVLIVTALAPDVTPHTLIFPVIHFIVAVRRKLPRKHIVVLCEKANDMQGQREEIEKAHPGLLRNVSFIVGMPRNPEHLKLCSVVHASAVTIIHFPVPTAGSKFIAKSHQYRQNSIVADRSTIIISLHLQVILNESCQNGRRPFILTHLIHENNLIFLHPFVASVPPTGEEKAEAEAERIRQMDIGASMRRGDEDEECPQDWNSADALMYDWPLVAAGSVLMQTAIDSLITQSVFNPHVVALWDSLIRSSLYDMDFTTSSQESNSPEVLGQVAPRGYGQQWVDRQQHRQQHGQHLIDDLSTNPAGMCEMRTAVNYSTTSPVVPTKKNIVKSKAAMTGRLSVETAEKIDDKENDNEDDKKKEGDGDKDEDVEESNDSPNSMKYASHALPPPPPACPLANNKGVDRVAVPKRLVGSTFGTLFQYFLQKDQSVTIAIYRQNIWRNHTHNKKGTSPRQPSTPHATPPQPQPLHHKQHQHHEHHQQQQEGQSRADKSSPDCHMLPFVILVPSIDTLLQGDDEVFLFRSV